MSSLFFRDVSHKFYLATVSAFAVAVLIYLGWSSVMVSMKSWLWLILILVGLVYLVPTLVLNLRPWPNKAKLDWPTEVATSLVTAVVIVSFVVLVVNLLRGLILFCLLILGLFF